MKSVTFILSGLFMVPDSKSGFKNSSMNMENENKTVETKKDGTLAKLEDMLKTIPEGSRQPIINLINKRKVELGLMESGLPPAGYKLKKSRNKSRIVPKENKEKESKEKDSKENESKASLRKIAMAVGVVKETEAIPRDIDIKNGSLKKDKRVIEEADSYKY